MKKHELLEKAMIDYPNGTRIYSTSGNRTTHETQMPYYIDECGSVQDNYGWLIYYKEIDRWATRVKKSILSGKCAIQVNNEREFKLLMEHYEGKGWKCVSEDRDYDVSFFSKEKVKEATYHDKFFFCCVGSVMESLADIKDPYKIIPFKDFAEEIGIEVPVFVMTSEDGVQIYSGDSIFEATLNTTPDSKDYNKWYLVNARGIGHWIADDNKKSRWISSPDSSKAFSTKESAQKWIDEQNKPNYAIISIDAKNSVTVTTDGTKISLIDGRVLSIPHQKLEEIYTAYKALQS